MSNGWLQKLEKSYYKNSNISMFIEDMTASFPIALGSFNEYRNFFYIEADNDSLKKILFHENNDFRDFLDYILPETLSKMMYSLIWRGDGYLYFKRQLDENGQLASLDILETGYERVRVSKNKIIFINTEWQKSSVTIPADEVVYYSLKGAGQPKNLFSKAIKKMNAIDTIGEISLLQAKDINYDFNEYLKQVEFDKLVATKNVYWLFRDFNNANLNDITLLYRLLKLKILRTEFLDYFLSLINKELEKLSKRYNINGTIKCRLIAPLEQLNDSLKLLIEGQISFEKVNSLLYKR